MINLESRKILGIIFIILGILFIVYPLYTSEMVSIIAGVCLISFGVVSIFNGFSIWSIVTHASLIRILLGILAILLGFLFFYSLDALAFVLSYSFYLIAFILIMVGLSGLFVPGPTVSKLVSALIVLVGFIYIILAVYSITQPLYIAIFVGVCLILEGLNLFLTGPVYEDEIDSLIEGWFLIINQISNYKDSFPYNLFFINHNCF